jgi:hypothetical protein
MVPVTGAANPIDDPADAASLAAHADRLAAAVEAALPGWVERCVVRRWSQWWGPDVPHDVRRAARDAADAAVAEVMPRLRALLTTDVDDQRANPLAIIRAAVVHPTRVLAGAGVPPVHRDEQAVHLFPDDVYDLTLGAFADLDPSVHEPGIVWGAAKAHVVLRRRRR